MKNGTLDDRVCAIYGRIHPGKIYRPMMEIKGQVRPEIWRAVVVPAETYYEIWGEINA